MRGRRKSEWAAVVVLAAALAVGAFAVAQAPAASAPVVIDSARPDVPSISGTVIAWADKGSGNWDIYTYDGATRTGRRITSDGYDQAMPSVYGNLVAYTDFSANQGDIVVHDLGAGTSSRIALSGPQLYPVISGDWLTYEDRSEAAIKVYVRDLAGTYETSFGAGNAAATRPHVGGDLLVFEQVHPDPVTSRAGDSDIKVFDLASKTEIALASSPAQELFPYTDGRYVVWAEATEGGSYKIRLWDRQSDDYTDVTDGSAGEQTMPVVEDGSVYWVHNESGKALHVDSYDISSGETSPYYTYSTGDVIALSASGRNTAWLENVGSRRRIRAVFDSSSLSGALAGLRPLIAVPAGRPLALVTGEDGIAPTITSTSVEPGERNVENDAALTVSFSEALSVSTVSAKTFTIVSADSDEPVPAEVTYSALTRSVTVRPEEPLADGAYALVVAPTVADASGNRLGTGSEVAFSTFEAAADVFPPSKTGISYARPSGLSNVEVAWRGATDDSGIIQEYRVYRLDQPLLAADLIPANLVATVGGGTLSTTVAKLADETSKAYSYYYAVAAVDPGGRVGPPSASVAPNPHGMNGTATRRDVRSCLRCHLVHGGPLGPPDLQANSAGQCYACHGTTPGEDSYGYASTMDTQGDFNDDGGIATGGAEGIGNDGWSIHRTSYLYAGDGSPVNYQCMACHTAHRKSYDADPTLSYGRLLRTYPAGLSGASDYSTDDAPYNESLCYQCHGTSSSLIDALSTGAYSNTGGNHETDYQAADVAHRPAIVMADRPPRTRPNGGTLPNIACTACHNEHGSANQGMTDYRQSNVNDTTYGQAGLCFECHTAGNGADGQPEVISAGAAPYAWNGRDVKAEFQRTSKHPTVAGNSGRWLPQSGTVFSQTLQAEFGTDTHNQTVASVLDDVVLDTFDVNTPIPPADYLYVVDSDFTTVGRTDSLQPGDAAWNADFNPVDIGTNPGSGAGAVEKNGYVFAMQGGASNVLRRYTPHMDAADAWGTNANTMWQNANTGSDIRFDATHDYVWALIGNYTPVNANGGTNIRRSTNFVGNTLAWYDTTGYDGPAFRTGGVDRRLSGGAAMVWLPANGSRPERLYVVNRDSTNAATRDGQLWYYDNPDNATGGTNWVTTGQVLGRTDNASDAGSRMAYFRIGTTDYIYFVRGQANIEYLLQIGNDAAGTITVLDNATANPWGANVVEGADLCWNGDTTQAGFRMWAMGPNNTVSKVATWDGSGLVWANEVALPTTKGTGSYLFYATANLPGSAILPNYYGTGTVTTPDISPLVGSLDWGTITWNGTVPANTTLSVRVRWSTDDFASWTDIPNVTSGSDLAALGVPAAAEIRLIGEFATSDPTNMAATPHLEDWSLTCITEVFDQSGMLTCANCHNAHEVKVAGATPWQMTRASDPMDIQDAAPADTGTFCTRCHQSASSPTFPSTRIRLTNQIVPYAVSFTPMDAATYPFFTGWDKQATNADWTGSRHNAVAAVANKCGTCHDPHASDFARLTALTKGATVRANTAAQAASSEEQNLCYGGSNDNSCHYYSSGTLQTWQVAGTGAPFNVATYKHPVATTGAHSDTEASSDLGVGNRHAECVDCHDPHAARAGTHTQGQSAAGNVLRGVVGIKPSSWPAMWTAPAAGDYVNERMTGEATDYEAYVCFKCHSGYTTRPNSPSGGFAETDVAMEFNPNNFSGHNVLGDVFTKAVSKGGYTWGKPASAARLGLLAPWGVDSEMTCSDCHTYSGAGAKGPHGSANKYILRWGGAGNWYANTLTTGAWNSATNFCGGCHTGTGTHPWLSDDSEHARACNHCHIAIPHGWRSPRLLRSNVDRTANPYVVPDAAGDTWYGVHLMNITDQVPSNEAACGDSCDSGRHPITGTFW